jgi:zinc protease
MIQLRASSFALLVFAAIVAAPVVHAQTGPRSGKWAHEGAPLKPDPRVTWGRLENGLRYALLPHAGVPGRVSLRLVVLSGSIDELPDELGIAHFTEHMAFNGTREFHYEDMIGFFQKLGMEYGSDVNAITTFDHTAFMLEYRENDPALLGEGLRLFRELAQNIAFEPRYIEKERRVIQSENRGRDGMEMRQQMASLGVLYRGTRLSERSPGGTEESVRTLDRERFLRFYQRCYRPDFMVIVAAGDFEAPAMEGWIRERFANLPRPAQPPPRRDEGKVDPKKALRAGVFRISDVGYADITAGSVLPPPKGPMTRESFIAAQRAAFAMRLLADRVAKMVQGSAHGDAGIDTLLGWQGALATARVAGDEWASGLQSLDEVVRATLQNGFEEREIDQGRRKLLDLSRHMLEQAPTLDPATLSAELADSIVEHRVYVGFENEFTWLREWLAATTPAQLQQALRSVWDVERVAFYIAGDVKIEGGEAEILKAVQQGRKNPLRVLRPEARRETPFELKKWGAPTTVVDRREVPELNARLLRFGNNVRVNFVPSSSEPGLASAIVRVGNGLLDMPGNRPALKEFGLQTLLASGTTYFTAEKVGELVEDHLLGFDLDVDDFDAFAFQSSMASEKLPVFLGLVTDFLNRPLFERAAHTSQKAQAAIGRIVGGIGMREGMRLLYDRLFKGDARFTSGTFNNYIGQSIVDVRNWLTAPLASGYVEVTIVGDLTEEQVVDIVSRTLGSLAPRPDTKQAPAPKPVQIAARPGFERIEFVGEQYQGVVIGTWPVDGADSLRDRTALHLLSKILELRVRDSVREKLGFAYSPMAHFEAIGAYPGFGLMQTMIDCAPADTERVAKLVEEIGAQLAAEGVTEGEFIGSRGILIGKIRSAMRDNAFLLRALKRAQEQPDSVQEVLKLRDGMIAAVTRDEVNTWAAKILPANRSRTAAIVPKPFIGIFQTGNP